MKVFLICPVRNETEEQRERISAWLAEAEKEHTIHWPPRDTPQDDPTGLSICCANRAAIASADEVWVWWEGKSEGRYFDLGMAFALGKPVRIVYGGEPPVPGKCYERMVADWSANGAD